MLGRLTIDALPLYSWIAMGGAAVTVLGGLVVLALILWLGVRYVWSEWLTSDDAFHDMKRRGVAYRRPARYTDIFLPRNSAIGVVIGGFAFVLGFAMVWHIWWLAIGAGLVILIALAARSFDDDTEYRITAAEVQAIEDRRYEASAKAPRHAEDLAPAHGRPVPRGAT